MKPINLYMRNFKSYGENAPELDFRNFDIILLTGDNGNGKSSIADAIAWALWGQCKGVTLRSGMDDLVRAGSIEMEVSFTFDEDGVVYKVIRKRDKKRGQSSLDLLIYDDVNSFLPAGGSTISETQAKIEKIIKLDYDTYLCTAYLSQGKADLFAMKTPKERKQILSEILNLSIYDRLEKKALEKRRLTENNTDVLDREINSFLDMISENNDVEARLNEVFEQLGKIEKQKQVILEKLQTLQTNLQEMEFCKRKEQDYRENLHSIRREKEVLEKNLAIVSDRIKAYQLLLQDEIVISQKYKRFQQLRAENDILNNKSRRLSDLDKQKTAAEQEIKTKEISIKNDIRLIEQEAKQHRLKIDKKDELLSTKTKLSEELKKLDEAEHHLLVLEEAVKNETKIFSMLSASVKVLDEKRSENIEKLEKLKNAQSICPVCSNLLDDVHKEELIEEAVAFDARLQEETIKAKLEIKATEDRIRTQNKIINDVKSKLKGRASAEGQLRSALGQLDDAEVSRVEIERLNKNVYLLQNSLANRDYAINEQDKLSSLIESINVVGYDPELHKRIESELKTLGSYQDSWIELQKAGAALSADVENRGHLISTLKQKEKALVDLDAQINELSVKTKGMPVIKEQIQTTQSERNIIESNAKDLETKRGMLIERHNAVKRAQKEILIKQTELENLRKMVVIYKILAEIYGKGGIQAAIIENAIPELAYKTNEILSKITDGRLNVEFLTQRDKKSGGTIETLDIKISDEFGTRKYETYSGGEEFRINFAIRIALSKVLAHRAGASLRMLILDEGFGALDEQGREKLVEAINSIRDEFDNILVITHIQDLKEAFPLRLEVTKEVNGSTFKMTG